MDLVTIKLVSRTCALFFICWQNERIWNNSTFTFVVMAKKIDRMSAAFNDICDSFPIRKPSEFIDLRRKNRLSRIQKWFNPFHESGSTSFSRFHEVSFLISWFPWPRETGVLERNFYDFKSVKRSHSYIGSRDGCKAYAFCCWWRCDLRNLTRKTAWSA